MQIALRLRPTLLASNRARALESPPCLGVQEKYHDLISCYTKTRAVIYPSLTICHSPLNINHYCILTLHKTGNKFLKKRKANHHAAKNTEADNRYGRPDVLKSEIRHILSKNKNCKYINKFYDQQITQKFSLIDTQEKTPTCFGYFL